MIGEPEGRHARPDQRVAISRRFILSVAGLLALVAMLAATWSTGVVSAHAELLAVTPSDGEVVATAPSEVVLRFSEGVSLAGGSARVLDDAGTPVSGDPRASADQVTIPLATGLRDGTYTVTFEVISEDSHPVSGATVFHVGAPSAGGGAVVEPAESAGWAVRAGATILMTLAYAGALVAVGGWWVLLAVAGGRPWARRSPRPPHIVVARAAALGAVALISSVPLRIARLGGGLGALRDDTLVSESLRGAIGVSTAVTAGGLLVVAALAVSRLVATHRAAAIATAAVGLVALAGFALEGHTRSQHPRGVMAAFDVLHLAAGAFWLGGIAVLAVTIRSSPERPELSRLVGRFSSLAVGAVAIVMVAGVGMAWIVLPEPSALFTTGYGLLLVTKAALVVPVIGVAWYNRRYLVPAVSTASAGSAAATAGRRRLGRTVVLELVLLLVVVGVTSVLVSRSPVASSAGPSTATTLAPSATVLPLSGGAGTVAFTIAPGRAGQNELLLTLRGPSGEPLVAVDTPTVELTEQALGVGPLRPIVHPVDDGQFHVIADVPLAGTYSMVIRVRVSDFDAATAETTLVID